MSKLAQLRAQRDAKAKAAAELNAKTPADQRMPAADASEAGCHPGRSRSHRRRNCPRNRLNQVAGDEHAEHEAALNVATNGGNRSDEAQALRAMLVGGLSI